MWKGQEWCVGRVVSMGVQEQLRKQQQQCDTDIASSRGTTISNQHATTSSRGGRLGCAACVWV